MNSITVSVKDLYEKAKEMLDDGMDTVELLLAEPERDGEDIIPAQILFMASSKKHPYEGVDYEEISSVN